MITDGSQALTCADRGQNDRSFRPRDLNRLELAGESVRAALEALAAAAPDWVATAVDVPGWSRRYRARVDTWRLPTIVRAEPPIGGPTAHRAD